MPPLTKTIEIPLELLEDKYWEGGGFCLECLEFAPFPLEPLPERECPLCREEGFYDVPFLIRKGILVSVD